MLRAAAHIAKSLWSAFRRLALVDLDFVLEVQLLQEPDNTLSARVVQPAWGGEELAEAEAGSAMTRMHSQGETDQCSVILMGAGVSVILYVICTNNGREMSTQRGPAALLTCPGSARPSHGRSAPPTSTSSSQAMTELTFDCGPHNYQRLTEVTKSTNSKSNSKRTEQTPNP